MSVNKTSVWPDTATSFTDERAMMQDRLPRSRLRYARTNTYRDLNRSALSKALAPGAEKPVSTSANEHPLTRKGRATSWLPGLANLGSVSR